MELRRKAWILEKKQGKGGVEMARNSAGVDTAGGGERENEAIDGERAQGT